MQNASEVSALAIFSDDLKTAGLVTHFRKSVTEYLTRKLTK